MGSVRYSRSWLLVEYWIYWIVYRTLALSLNRRPFLSLSDGYNPSLPGIFHCKTPILLMFWSYSIETINSDTIEPWIPFIPPGCDESLSTFANFPPYPSFESQVFLCRSQAFRVSSPSLPTFHFWSLTTFSLSMLSYQSCTVLEASDHYRRALLSRVQEMI